MSRARSFSKLINKDNYATYSGSDSVTDISAVSLPQGTLGFRNKIINGNFDIWQRGTSQTSAGYGSADRWNCLHSGSSKTASQQSFTVGQTDVPGNPKYYLQHVVSSVAGTGNYCAFLQQIEGVNTLAGQTATLSFWAKADSNKSIATEFRQLFGTGGSPSATVSSIGVVTHNLTTSWQKFTTTVPIPSISGKTIGSDSNDRLQINFWFDAGSNWNSRNNSLGQQSGTFDIAQVQLEEGTVPTPFEHRPIGTELSLCQRYYYLIGREQYARYAIGYAASATNIRWLIFFKTTMRTIPDLEQSGNFIIQPGTLGTFDIESDTTDGTGNQCLLRSTDSSGLSAGNAVSLHSSNDINAYLAFYAEL